MGDRNDTLGDFFTLEDWAPQVHPRAFVAPGAVVIGQVRMAELSSVWFNSVLRADSSFIVIGEGSNVQDNSTIHVEGPHERSDGQERGCRIGRGVTVGHNCVLHSCTLEDDCLIGMGAVVMSGAIIGRGALVGAGTLVLENTVVPPFALIVGNPGKVRKVYEPEQVLPANQAAAEIYRERVRRYLSGLKKNSS